MGETKENRDAKVEHLKLNWAKYKLQTYPWDRKVDDPARQGREIAIIDEMKRAGLLSTKTRWHDVRIADLIAEARKLIKE